MAKGEPVTPPVPVFEFVDALDRKLEMTTAESKLLQDETTKAMVEEGGLTRFALSQGVTAVARQLDDFDRKAEFEKAGWQVMTNAISIKDILAAHAGN
ncbi:MAG: hypothetical protein ACRENP_10705 [Longimicrobiales bacterium]